MIRTVGALVDAAESARQFVFTLAIRLAAARRPCQRACIIHHAAEDVREASGKVVRRNLL
jgi:hypothetical protein